MGGRIQSVFAAVAVILAPGAASAQELDGATEAGLVIEVSAVGEDGGAERVGQLHTGSLGRGQTRSLPARLRAGRCYRLVGQGGPGVSNLDVSIARGRAVLARDSGTGVSAVARYCTGARPEQVRLGASVFRGQGPYGLALFVLPEGATESVEEEVTTGETPLERLASLGERHGGGMRPVTAPTRETLADGEVVERDISLTPGRCYRVLAASEAGVEDLDLAVRGPTSALLQEDGSEDSSATLGVLRPLCPAAPGQYRLVLRADLGGGALAWQVLGSVSSSGAGSGAARAQRRFRVGGAGTGYIPNRIRARHREAGEGRLAVADPVTGTLRTSEQHEVVVPVEGRHCYVALAAGVPSVRDLDLRVVDAYGHERATDETHDATPAVRFCPSVAGRWKVQVRMFNGYGRYGVQVFGAERR